MSAFKSLTSQDVIVVPFVVNKSFSFVGSASLNEDNVFIERLIGVNITRSFEIGTEPITGTTASSGFTSSYYQRDIYNSIKQLYYSNELPNPEGTYIVTDVDNNIVESNLNTNVHSRFDNYLNTTLSSSRYFPTASNSRIGVISIPSQLYGDYVNPNTFEFTYPYTPTIVSSSYNNPNATSGDGLAVLPIDGINLDEFELIDPQGNITLTEISGSINIIFSGSRAGSGGSSTTFYLSSSISGVLASDTISGGFVTQYFVLSSLNYTPTEGEIISIWYQVNSGLNVIGGTLNISYSTPLSIDKVYITDDGEGYLIESSSQSPIGIISYQHGIATVTDIFLLNNFLTTPSVTCSFQSSRNIYETQYKCTIRENEFNYSLNPSLISGSNITNPLLRSSSLNRSGQMYDFVTGSSFAPYVTTVGLYNENQELLAVAKLSQPLPTSRTTDTSILINIDR